MKFLLRSLLFASVVSLWAACSDDRAPTLPGYSGRPGEMIVVCSKSEWKGAIGDSIRSVFLDAQYGLPQDEPFFTLIHTTPDKFQPVFQTFRNVFIVTIDENRMVDAELQIRRNVWAKAQLVAEILSPDEAGFYEELHKKRTVLINYFNNKELDRLYRRNKQFGNGQITQEILDGYALKLIPQKDVYIASRDSHVVWLRIEREKSMGGFQHQISQGLLVYYYPYTSKQQFLDSNLLTTMDEMLRTYVPGPVDSTYMELEYRYVPPRSAEFNFREHYAKEFRGLWGMHNYAMGGPFIAMATLDEDNDRIVGAIGYVYAPQFDKREFLREVDAMIKSLEFGGEKKPAASSETAGN